jgi:hypothetical protein
VRHIAERLPSASRHALLGSYKVGFTDALTTILLIGSLLAIVGAVCAFALVRSRDFVSQGEPELAPAPAG